MSEDGASKMDWLPQDSATASLVEHWRRHQFSAQLIAVNAQESMSLSDSVSIELQGVQAHAENHPPTIAVFPDVLIKAMVVVFGDRVEEGHIVEGIAVPWLEIIAQLEQNPNFLFEISWRKLEEIIAGAYTRAGWPEVILTPRSGDGGRDVIATRPGIGSIRILDQVKAYKPGNLVSADEIRSMIGVLELERNVSKGLVTTTSNFAPGIEKDPKISQFMPYRLELKNGKELRDWLLKLGKGGKATD